MTASDPDRDPFGEQAASRWRVRRSLLGGRFTFHSNSRQLLLLAEAAYAGLPSQPRSRPAPAFDIELRLTPARTLRGAHPPVLRPVAGPGDLVGGIMDAGNFVLLLPAAHAGLVAVSSDLLSLPYYVRYELIEFAVFTLASRAQGLLSLHAACVGKAGRGVLLMGASGAGKSTLSLHSALQGMEFLSEDAAFVDVERLLVTGVPNFLHVEPKSVRLIENPAAATRVRASPTIRRRSGVAKFEVDLRQLGARVAKAPLELTALVFLSTSRSTAAATLQGLSPSETLRRFVAAQSDATLMPQWPAFRRHLSTLPGYELRRGHHPTESVVALSHLLERRRRRARLKAGLSERRTSRR